ncbi:DUF4336 domain-containing protein [Nannocystaceae bacterium ST9]
MASLRQLAPNLWEIEYRGLSGPVEMRYRMTVVRWAGERLWLHSPIAIDDALAVELAALGRVSDIVAPNRFHHLHAGSSKQRYPEACLWAAAGLPPKRPDVAFDMILGDEPPAWIDEIAMLPLRGVTLSSEVVFHHRASKTLICSDLIANPHDAANAATRILWRALGVWQRAAQNHAFRAMIRDRAAMAECVDEILAWDIERVIMAHGDILEVDAKPTLARALRR